MYVQLVDRPSHPLMVPAQRHDSDEDRKSLIGSESTVIYTP